MNQPHPLAPSGVESTHLRSWQRILHYAAYSAFIGSGFLPGLVGYIEKHLFPGWENYVVFSTYAVQSCTFLMLGTIATLQTPRVSDKYKRASLAVVQFHRSWVMLWLVWSALYIVFAAQELLKAKMGIANIMAISLYWDCGINSLNNLQTVFIVLSYIYLSIPTNPGGKDNLERLFITIWLLTAFINWIYILAFHPDSSALGLLIFRIFSGLAAGSALALLVGQIGNKYIDPPRATITLLYLYAVIQLSYEEFVGHDHDYIQRVATTIALPLKLLLYGLIYSFTLVQISGGTGWGRSMRQGTGGCSLEALSVEGLPHRKKVESQVG